MTLRQKPRDPHFFASVITVKLFYFSIEIKVFQENNNMIALKQQLLGIILCFFMHLKWPWLLRFFAKML
jgi:hypothetical protein